MGAKVGENAMTKGQARFTNFSLSGEPRTCVMEQSRLQVAVTSVLARLTVSRPKLMSFNTAENFRKYKQPAQLGTLHALDHALHLTAYAV